MKRIAPLAMLSVGALALVGCSSDGGDQERIDELEAQIEELQEAESSTEPDVIEAEAVDEPTDDAEPTEEAEPAVEADVENDGETTPIGEPVEFTEWLETEPAGTLTLDNIERNYTNPECAEWGDDPESGEFVALHFTVEAYPGSGDLYLFEEDFFLLDEDDNMLSNEIHTSSAWSCGIEAGGLEAPPGGAKSSGIVLLDTTLESGTLVYGEGSTDVRWDF